MGIQMFGDIALPGFILRKYQPLPSDIELIFFPSSSLSNPQRHRQWFCHSQTFTYSQTFIIEMKARIVA